MIAHVVLFKPKAGLSDEARAQLLDALRDAHASIPQIRRFSIGSRMTAGRAYEALARDFPFFVLLEFASGADLDAYLAHPTHERLSRGFYHASEAAEAYDFDLEEMPEALTRL